MGKRKVITEEDILGVEIGGTLNVPPNCIITASATDRAHERKIKIVPTEDPQTKVIVIGADHAGVEMKEELKKFLEELGYTYQDVGTHDKTAVDYPDIAFAVGLAVARGECHLGIIVDGAGIGSCIAANKVPGIRAAMCYDEATAKNSREHNFANVLTLGSRMIDQEKMRSIVKIWLETRYGEERHARRVQKITAFEKQFRSKE